MLRSLSNCGFKGLSPRLPWSPWSLEVPAFGARRPAGDTEAVRLSCFTSFLHRSSLMFGSYPFSPESRGSSVALRRCTYVTRVQSGTLSSKVRTQYSDFIARTPQRKGNCPHYGGCASGRGKCQRCPLQALTQSPIQMQIKAKVMR